MLLLIHQLTCKERFSSKNLTSNSKNMISTAIFKRTLLLLASLPLFYGTASAQSENALLWKISGNGLEKPSYLFGTIHIICPDDMVWNEAFESSFKETELLVLELDMDDPNMTMEMQKHSMNAGMKNFSQHMEADERELVNGFMTKNFGMGMDQLGIMKPFALSSMVSIKYLDCQQPGSYEMRFVQLAKRQEKEVIGLETVSEQMSIFDTLSMDKQIDMLVETISRFDETKQEFTDLVGVYREQNLARLHEMMLESPEYSHMLDALLYERNAAWIEKIEKIAHEQPAFFAVGAAHLGAEKGVIQLLSEAGYELTPVAASGN